MHVYRKLRNYCVLLKFPATTCAYRSLATPIYNTVVPTIYDILPTLENNALALLHSFMATDDGAFYLWEIVIFLPAANAYLHYLKGVNDSLKNDNYLSAMANLRCLIEALGAIVYDGTAKLPKEAYDKFIKTGRLPKWDNKKGIWVTLRTGELVTYAQLIVNPKINLREIYNHCCDILHFSATHLSFLGGFIPETDSVKRISRIKKAISKAEFEAFLISPTVSGR